MSREISKKQGHNKINWNQAELHLRTSSSVKTVFVREW